MSLEFIPLTPLPQLPSWTQSFRCLGTGRRLSGHWNMKSNHGAWVFESKLPASPSTGTGYSKHPAKALKFLLYLRDEGRGARQERGVLGPDRQCLSTS